MCKGYIFFKAKDNKQQIKTKQNPLFKAIISLYCIFEELFIVIHFDSNIKLVALITNTDKYKSMIVWCNLIQICGEKYFFYLNLLSTFRY